MRSNLLLVLRHLRNARAFTATAVLMLAVGIGSTTTIFSLVDAVLLRPLPFPHAEQLVDLGDRVRGAGWGSDSGGPVAARDVVTYIRDTRAFASLGGFRLQTLELSGSGEPVQINSARMTAGVFKALNVAPLFGRVFTEEEDTQKTPVTVLSYGTWRERFHGDSGIVGSRILLNRTPYQVIGVMPPGFEFPVHAGPQNRLGLWVPMSFTAEELAPESSADWSFEMVGRLKPEVSLAQAQSDAERVAAEIGRGLPEQFAHFHIDAVVSSLSEITVRDSRPLLRMLFMAVTVVLLIACANLAGLLLVRAIQRQREIAVRRALGASARNLLEESLLESTILTVSGGLLGIGLAGFALHFGLRFLPKTVPRVESITLNWAVVVFALLLAILTGLACGVIPSYAALKTNVLASLKEGGRTGSAGKHQTRLRSVLVVVEIAVALVLTAASGLLLRSFLKMESLKLGFQPDHVITGQYSLPQKQYGTQFRIDTFNQALLRRLNHLPGVRAAGWTSVLPARGYYGSEGIVPESPVKGSGSSQEFAVPVLVEGDYFRATGIPLLRGRYFTDADDENGQMVVIVDRALSERYWPKQDPIGKRIRLGTEQMQTPWMTVVGEIANAMLDSPDEGTDRQFYQPVTQLEKDFGPYASASDLNGNEGFIALRSALPATQMENVLRTTVRSLDPQLPLNDVQTMDEIVGTSEAPRRFNTVLISGFAAAAVLLAMLGTYSVMAFSVASRMEEMAIRMALGAQPGRIVQLVLRSALLMAGIGCILGLTGAALASRLLRSFLFRVNPFDPRVMALAAIVVFALALLASALPAQRAASIDPIKALRGL